VDLVVELGLSRRNPQAGAGVRFAVVSFSHFPPSDAVGAERLRAATVAWAPLLAALHAVGVRPYLELHRGGRDDPLRLYCELEGDLLLDLSIEDEEVPDAPPDEIDGDWAVFVQDADGNYLADVLIDSTIDYDALAHKLAELVDAVTRGERPKFVHW
jgi:hypothetical protein